jgi:endonuclease YncB( thermonuclease family)
MKFGIFFVTAAFSLLFQLDANAKVSVGGDPEAIARAFLKSKMNVSLPASCELIERMAKDPSGPFEKTDYCNEADFKGLKTLTGRVYRVVDGDTIHFYAHNKLLGIRMLGMDTPELHYQSMAQPKWGEIAKQSLRTMVKAGDEITLELDQVRCDRYGRILGHVYKGKTNLNFEQIRRGYAANYCIYPNKMHCSAYEMAYVKADQEGLGMHRDSCLVTPYVWRRAMASEEMSKPVMDSRTQKMYTPADYYKVPVPYRIFYSTEHK